MGLRGRLPRSATESLRLGRPSHGARTTDLIAPARTDVPPAPSDLGSHGVAAWNQAWRSAWLNASHFAMVEDLARLHDDLQLCREALTKHGALLEEPLVTPKGEVVGSRRVANPAEAMMRRTLKAILELQTALGLTPTARARLGLNLVEAEQKVSKLDQIRAKQRARRER